MKFGKISRRRFILTAAAAAPMAAVADAVWLEPEWVKVRHLKFAPDQPPARLAHVTDIHHKGDRAYLESVVRQINAASPDAVLFTGDLVEQKRFLPETLELLSAVKAPIFGVPGNHDYWSGANFNDIRRSFARNGGAWILDSQMKILGGRICLTGATCMQGRPVSPPPVDGCRNIMLLHYPLMVEQLAPRRYDLILAGHSHGGQFRLPFYGALMLPYWVGRYDLGLFQTPSGPLYVNPGIGWLVTPIRFLCRPEITVIEV